MEHLLFHHSEVVTLSLLLCAVLATVGAMLMARSLVSMTSTTFRHFLELRFRPAALRHTEKFEVTLAGYQEVADLLDRYAPDYSAVFNEANWSQFIIKLAALNNAYNELCDLLGSGESKEALCLAEFLSAQGEELAEWKYHSISEEWEDLGNWEQEAYDIVCKVVETLPPAVKQARSLGMYRSTATEETLVLIDRIRAQL
jgi:hypothetical protein